MGLFDIFKKKKKSAELDGVVTERLFNTSNQGCNTDEIPEGTGEFGLDPTNPIPVNGIWENETYLGKLKTSNGESITWERKGSTSVDNIDNMIDIYEIFDSKQNHYSTLYISPYHQKTSNKIPNKFIGD